MPTLQPTSHRLSAKLPDDAELQWLVEYASAVCDMPISFVSELSLDLQRFRAEVGLGFSETPIELSFCVHAVKGDDLLEIPDASKDARTKDHPMVKGPERLRFYAGMPLANAAGKKVGSFCVMDRRPRELTEVQRQTLALLARFVELRLALAEATERAALEQASRRRVETETREHGERLIEGLPCPVGVVDRTYRTVEGNERFRKSFDGNDAVLQGLIDFAFEQGEAIGDSSHGKVRCVKDGGDRVVVQVIS